MAVFFRIGWLGVLFWGLLVSETGFSFSMPAMSVLEAKSGDQKRLLSQRRSNKRRPVKRKPLDKTVPTQTKQDSTSDSSSPAGAPVGLSGRNTRIEFDAQMIKGQTTKAGEVQILERKDTALKSMVQRRTDFRKEIIQTVFPEM